MRQYMKADETRTPPDTTGLDPLSGVVDCAP